METKAPGTMDNLVWLAANKDQLSLFLEVKTAKLLKGPVDQRLQQLVDRGIIKSDEYGTRLSEQGWLIVEGVEALSFLDEV